MPTLREVLPREALCYPMEERFMRYLDVEVVQKVGAMEKVQQRWPGKHKNVYAWWKLANGYAVGWNENPGRGWSFPVVKAG